MHNIIFSNGISYRWKRHLLFWLAVFLYHLVRIGMMMPEVNNAPAIRALLNFTLTWGLFPNMFITYLVAYYLIPKYFNRQRYIAFTIGIILAMFILIAYSIIRTYFEFNHLLRSAIGFGGRRPQCARGPWPL